MKLLNGEIIYDAEINNLKWTMSQIYKVLYTFGLYYLEVSSLIAHRESFVLTNKRFVRHSQLLSDFTGCEHSRVCIIIL